MSKLSEKNKKETTRIIRFSMADPARIPANMLRCAARLPRGLRAWMTIKLSSTGRKTRSLEEQLNKLRQQVRADKPRAHCKRASV